MVVRNPKLGAAAGRSRRHSAAELRCSAGSSAGRANDKEAIQNAECECGHGKKVHRCNGLAMVSQECQPALRDIWRSRRSAFEDCNTTQDIAGLSLALANATSHFAGIVPASYCEHSLLSLFRLALFRKRVRIIPFTNTNFIISCDGGFDEPRKHFKPSHSPPHTTYVNARGEMLSGQNCTLY